MIRNDPNVESWRIEEQRLDVQIVVRVKDGMVKNILANADVSAEVYDLDVSDYPDVEEENEADRKAAELETLANTPGWRYVY